MSLEFDLFGKPVPRNAGKPGRNEHAPDPEIAKKIRALLIARLSLKRIAEEVGLSVPTMRKHYFANRSISIQAARAMARQEQRARAMVKLDEQVEAGNVTAIKELRRILDEEDMRDLAAAARGPETPRREAPVPKGKKDQEIARARAAIENDPLLQPGLVN